MSLSNSVQSKKKFLNVVLIGNPNVGKTTLFNRITGSNQYTSNWPGVTVEKKEGIIKKAKILTKITDLPGVYSLSPHSPEELVTRNFLLNDSYDLILNILDSTNLERNLYLTTQLMELDCPILIALNMCDLLKKQGKVIDFCEFESLINIETVLISANKNIGIENLKDKIFNFPKNIKLRNNKIYNEKIEQKILQIEEIFSKNKKIVKNKRFIITKILEDDKLINLYLNSDYKILSEINKIKKNINYEEIVNLRYDFSLNISEKVIKNENKIKKNKFSRKVDKILTNKYIGIPIFLIIIGTIFFVTFGSIGSFFEYYISLFLEKNLFKIINIVIVQFKFPFWVKSFILDAIILSIGQIIKFLPQIIILLASLSFLEDIGYMARVAFIMDRFLRKFGLSGKSFMPLFMGFGCNVPAITGTRILENQTEKNLAIFFIPFLSCGAKMPVYLLFLGTFFPSHKVIFIFFLYVISIFFGILTLILLKYIFLKNDDSFFIMELPDYKIPSIRNILNRVWEKTKDFLERAGTVILGSTIVVWFLQSFDLKLKYVQKPSESLLAHVGNFIAPVFTPCGFGNWQTSVALITGFLSKETIVSTMAIIYRPNIENFSRTLSSNFTNASAISFLIFALFYIPCTAVVASINQEVKSLKLTFGFLLYQTSLAWFLSFLTYQICKNLI